MRARMALLGMIVSSMVLIAGCSKSSVPTVSEDEVIVSTDQLDVAFSRGEPFSETYMVFGGLHMTQKNAIGEVSLSTLSMEDAIPIYERYPDFQKCASPGASRAKRAVREMNIVPADSNVLDVLKKVLSEHTKSLKRGGDRVCVRLEGSTLEMTAAMLRKADMDIMKDLPPQVRSDYFLVEWAEIVEASTALAGG